MPCRQQPSFEGRMGNIKAPPENRPFLGFKHLLCGPLSQMDQGSAVTRTQFTPGELLIRHSWSVAPESVLIGHLGPIQT